MKFSQFITTEKAETFATFTDLYSFILKEILEPNQAKQCGQLIHVVVTGGEYKGFEIQGCDPVSGIRGVSTGVPSVSFLVHPYVKPVEAPLRSLASVLVRQPKLQPIPDWSGSGHAAYGSLYTLLKN